MRPRFAGMHQVYKLDPHGLHLLAPPNFLYPEAHHRGHRELLLPRAGRPDMPNSSPVGYRISLRARP